MKNRMKNDMKEMIKTGTLFAGVLVTLLCAAFAYGTEAPALNPEHPDRQPARFDGRPIPPDIGCFWAGIGTAETIRAFPDHVGKDGTFDAFCLTVRGLESLREHPENVAAVRDAVQYALERYGIGAHLDIDLRIARLDFEKDHPNLLQEQLCLEERAAGNALEFVLRARDLSDHYTAVAPYYVRGVRLLKAWKYRKSEKGEVLPDSVSDISAHAKFTKHGEKECHVAFAPDVAKTGDFICVAVAFAYRYPDLFSPEALACEAAVYEKYASVPATGTGKDEFGMPPAFMNGIDTRKEHWYSENMRKAYAARSGGRDLVDDCFLMFLPQRGMEPVRASAYDHYRRMTLDRMLQFEAQHYDLTKKYWGPDAFVGVHPTWFPWPNINEFRKNGLSWWKVKRDFAQTDEHVPFCCRNAMAKGTNTPWINMFYATYPEPYIYEHWTAALSAGRVHLHTLYPRRPDTPKEGHLAVVDAGAGRIRTAVRLLNYITGSPVESTVAVVFGHFGVMNPARPEYKKVGVDLCDRFAENGYPADLIPCDEVNTVGLDGKKRWTLDTNGFLRYGPQAYRYVVFYSAGQSDHADFAALEKLAGTDCKTKIVRIPTDATPDALRAKAAEIVHLLRDAGIPGHTPWEHDHYQFTKGSDEVSVRPRLRGVARLIDETTIWVAAEKNACGDPIELRNESILSNDGTRRNRVSMNCVGIGAVRFDDRGHFAALAAAGLRSFDAGGLAFELQSPTDIVLWRDARGLHGIFQTATNDLPDELKRITADWKWLKRDF